MSARNCVDVSHVVHCWKVNCIHGALTAQNTTLNLDNSQILWPFAGSRIMQTRRRTKRKVRKSTWGRWLQERWTRRQAITSAVELGVIIYMRIR